MRLSGASFFVRAIAAVVGLLILIPAGTTARAAGFNGAEHPLGSITVMTQNLDEGTDFTPLFSATTPQQFVTAAAGIYHEVLISDIQSRAGRVAAEIAESAPDAVSIQEASLWRSPSGTIDAFAALQAALAADGAHYTAVRVLNGFAGGAPLPGIGTVTFLDRDVLLVRDDKPFWQLRVSNVQSGLYANMVTLPSAVGPIPEPRGWIAADIAIWGRVVRLITTHLDGLNGTIQSLQAGELLSGPANTALPVILAGDLNTGPGATFTAAYQKLINARFVDTWVTANPGKPGLTYPLHAEDPYGPSTPNQRIDLILVKGSVQSSGATLVGTTMHAGLWPSDHAGVVSTIEMPFPRCLADLLSFFPAVQLPDLCIGG